MKSTIMNILFFGSLYGGLSMAAESQKANDLVQFLSGKWENVSFEVADKKEIVREAYPETMVVKDFDTLTITAHGYKDGKDLTKDMHLELRGDDVTMKQGTFVAKGKREGNVYMLKGIENKMEYRFRLYTMGDKYVFHREVWSDGKVQHVDMSYLIRK